MSHRPIKVPEMPEPAPENVDVGEEQLPPYRNSNMLATDQRVLWPTLPEHDAYVRAWADEADSDAWFYSSIGTVVEILHVEVGGYDTDQRILVLESGLMLFMERSRASYPGKYVERLLEERKDPTT